MNDMLIGIDDIQPYERMQLSIALQAIQNSPQFNHTQKVCVESKFQEIVDILTAKEYVG